MSIGSGCVLIHATRQIRFGQVTALVLIYATDLLHAGQIVCHDLFALAYRIEDESVPHPTALIMAKPIVAIHTIVVQREAPSLGTVKVGQLNSSWQTRDARQVKGHTHGVGLVVGSAPGLPKVLMVKNKPPTCEEGDDG